MIFRLVDSGWDKLLDNAVRSDHSIIRIVCPFIKERAASRLLRYGRPKAIQIITRFNPAHFCEGVCDISALRLLIENGAEIRGVRNVHAKLYLIGASRAIVTSANLTECALTRNHEFGFEVEDAGVVDQCGNYFNNIWKRARPNLRLTQLAKWERIVDNYVASGARKYTSTGFKDEGADLRIPPDPIVASNPEAPSQQAFVKFFGRANRRELSTTSIIEVVQRSGCHWACTYPKNKRPRQVEDGAVMYMGRLMEEPNDIVIFGRAIGLHYERGRDDANPAEARKRDFKKEWPHYIRVHHPEFIAGNMSNGISLNHLMKALRSNSFASTKRNAARGVGNTNPRRAYMQKAAVELSPEGAAWLNGRLERAFTRHGRLGPLELDPLDWPTLSRNLAAMWE
jgi:hypothetical protein